LFRDVLDQDPAYCRVTVDQSSSERPPRLWLHLWMTEIASTAKPVRTTELIVYLNPAEFRLQSISICHCRVDSFDAEKLSKSCTSVRVFTCSKQILSPQIFRLHVWLFRVSTRTCEGYRSMGWGAAGSTALWGQTPKVWVAETGRKTQKNWDVSLDSRCPQALHCSRKKLKGTCTRPHDHTATHSHYSVTARKWKTC
jgi:hypothetical protein